CGFDVAFASARRAYCAGLGVSGCAGAAGTSAGWDSGCGWAAGAGAWGTDASGCAGGVCGTEEPPPAPAPGACGTERSAGKSCITPDSIAPEGCDPLWLR